MTDVKVLIPDDLDNTTVVINRAGKVEAITPQGVLDRITTLESYFQSGRLKSENGGFVVGKIGSGGVPLNVNNVMTPGMYSTVSFATTNIANGFPVDGGIAEVIVTANAQVAYFSTYKDETGRVQQSPATYIRTFLKDSGTWKPWVRIS